MKWLNQEKSLVFVSVLVLALLLLAPVAGHAAMSKATAYVVNSDLGGVIGERVKEINRIQTDGRRVEIRGRLCLSSCTMFLGVDDVCISPKTRFGFHGPSYYGKPLSPERFEFWSSVIAEYYPAPIKKWFMETGRFKIKGYYAMEGVELIKYGIPTC